MFHYSKVGVDATINTVVPILSGYFNCNFSSDFLIGAFGGVTKASIFNFPMGSFLLLVVFRSCIPSAKTNSGLSSATVASGLPYSTFACAPALE